jgi:hypothetical protein
MRTALRLPTVNPSRTAIKRPSKRQAIKARRALRLRSLLFAGKLAKMPHRLTIAAGRRWWDGRLARIPGAIDQRWLIPTVPEPKLKTASGPKSAIPRTPDPTIPGGNVIAFSLHRTQGAAMHSPREAIADAFAQLAHWEPESGTDVARLMEEFKDMFDTIGTSFTTLADRMQSEMPLAAPVVDSVRDIGAGVLSMGSIAENAHSVMLEEHEADLARQNDPRPGENLWNPEKEGH